MAIKDLYYDISCTPSDNLRNFFEEVKVLRFELIPTLDKKKWLLTSHWTDDQGLNDITAGFWTALSNHLWEQSMDEAKEKNAMRELETCINIVHEAMFFFSLGKYQVQVARQGAGIEDGFVANYKGLPEADKDRIHDCFSVLRAYWPALKVYLVEEHLYLYQRENYIKQTKYQWQTEKFGAKREFSELVLALYESRRFVRIDGKQITRQAFARDLAAFFGLKSLRFEQDIKSVCETKENKTEFLDKLGKVTNTYYRNRMEEEEKKRKRKK